MPNKTIYVADADLPIFEQAQELAGENLSATIAEALRRYVENAEARARGLEEIIVKVGKVAVTRKRFRGRLLAKGHVVDEDSGKHQWYSVYQTAKGALAVHIKNHPKSWYERAVNVDMNVDVDMNMGRKIKDWKDLREFNWDEWWKKWSQENGQMMSEWQEIMKRKKFFSQWSQQAEYLLEIYPSLEQLKEHLPEELYQAVYQAMQEDPIEDLDI